MKKTLPYAIGVVGIAATAVDGFVSPNHMLSRMSFVPMSKGGGYRRDGMFMSDSTMYADGGAVPDMVMGQLSDAIQESPLVPEKEETVMGPIEALVNEITSMDSTSDEPVYSGPETLEELKVKEPIGVLVNEVKVLDLNTMINTGIMICVVLAVLTKLTMVDSGAMRGWTVAEMAYRIPMDNWQSYSAILEQAPISTKAVTSATVYTIGDVISQTTEGREIGQLDRPRILRSLLAGLIGHGPLSHLWYNWSEGIFTDVLHWTDWWSFFPKVMVDQASWGPFWNNTYILLLGLMKFEKPETIFSEMKRTTIPLIVSGLKLWPLAHCVTYGLIPVENRLLWVDMVEIIWVTILATAASGAAEETTIEEEIAEEAATTTATT